MFVLLRQTLKVEVKKKGKLSLCLTKHHAMKTYWGSGGIAPLILDLGTRDYSGNNQKSFGAK
jgi:hypothetical protein